MQRHSYSNILVSDGLSEEGLALLRSVGEVVVNPKISAGELLVVLPEFDALVVRSRTKVTAQVVEAGRQLKVIGRAGVGVDNIDVPAAVRAGIIVVNSPLAATIAVAEHTLGLLLSLARSIPAANATLKQEKWEKNAFMGAELHGKALGLVGLGRIGMQVAQLAKAFGMTVRAYDPYIPEKDIRARGVSPTNLNQLLESSDYVSLHLPLTSTSQHLIGEAEFMRMKKGARMVCAARGGVINEEALRAALDAGYLAGAALDVFAAEPPLPGSIATQPKVIATPHIGAQTAEAQKRAGIAIAEEVIAVLEGKEPRWRVTANE